MASAKTVLITGANSGIGLATAHILAKQGWNVLSLCRNPLRGEAVAMELRQLHPNIIAKNFTADLSDFQSLQTAASAILQEFPTLDVLLNNAGYYPEKIEYVGGIEKTLYASHLGHMLLTRLLMPALEGAKEARIINVSSDLHKSGKVERFFEEPASHSTYKAYSDAKLANLLYTMGLADRLPAHITTYSLHPGVVNTGFAHNTNGWMGWMVRLFGRFLITPDKGAATSVFLATADIEHIRPSSGKYYANQRLMATSSKEISAQNAEWLWKKSEAILENY
jgi:retinol dehydrogenase 12